MKPWELYEYQKNLDYKTNTLDYDWDKDTIDNLMDEVYQQMPEEELEVFYQKFCIE